MSDEAKKYSTKMAADIYKIKPSYKRMDHKWLPQARWNWDPDWKNMFPPYSVIKRHISRKDPGYSQLEYALDKGAQEALGYTVFGPHAVTSAGLHKWRPPATIEKWRESPAVMSKKVKKAAKLYGASLVGIGMLDRRWTYSMNYNYMAYPHTHKPIIFSREHKTPQELKDKWVIPESVKYAIVLALDEVLPTIQTSPNVIASAETTLKYSLQEFLVNALCVFISELGYNAIPSTNDLATTPALAVDAGLGLVGRNNILTTPEFGSAIRLCKVLTDLPLEPDGAVDFKLREFCSACLTCAKKCPAKAISFKEPTFGEDPNDVEAPVKGSNPGVLKWYSNQDRCFRFWCKNGSDCSNCQYSCPWTKPAGKHHDFVRWITRTLPLLNPLWVRLDDILGYGRHISARGWWNSEWSEE